MLRVAVLSGACVIFLMESAWSGASSAERERRAVPAVDETVREASRLGLSMPVMCREWHVWWGSPCGSSPGTPEWSHWKGLQRFGKFDPRTTIEETVPGLAWRRYLNSVGYPLLGPYDSSRPDIIRWQLETAQAAGLACLHVHLWPSLWDEGADFTPLPVFETILQTAARLGYPVAVHDEIMFRGQDISGAQKVENSIRRASLLLKRYGRHPGWYKIAGEPVYYFQNWSKWLSAQDMRRMFEEVERQVGPVHWMVEMSAEDAYLAVPQIRSFIGSHTGWFLHTPPYGAGPHPWDRLKETMSAERAKVRAAGKRYGALAYSRFNNNNDRGEPGRGRIDAEDGMFFVRSLAMCKELQPDFVIVAQWNDFEEGAFLEPAWDFDGWNGDPYRWCRILAASVGKDFKPARLPARDQVDPFIRRKLYGDTQPGDMGPVFHFAKLDGRSLSWSWARGSGDPVRMRFVQRELLRWRPGDEAFGGVRLANLTCGDGEIVGAKELRFFVPNAPTAGPHPPWIALRVACGEETGMRVLYRSEEENYRVDSRWERRSVDLRCAHIDLQDGTRVHWVPLHGARFSGHEGDIIVRLDGKQRRSRLLELLIWRPEAPGHELRVDWRTSSVRLPEQLEPYLPFVAVAFDSAGNAGLPRLFYSGMTLPTPERDPMDLVRD